MKLSPSEGTRNDRGQILNFLFHLLFLAYPVWTKGLTLVYLLQYPCSCYTNPFLNQPLFSWGISKKHSLQWWSCKMDGIIICCVFVAGKIRWKLSARLLLHKRVRPSFTATLLSHLDRVSVFLLMSGGSSTSLPLTRLKCWREKSNFIAKDTESLEDWGLSFFLMLGSSHNIHSLFIKCRLLFIFFKFISWVYPKYRTKRPAEISYIDKVSTILK